MLMATRQQGETGWLVRWLRGCHRAQLYRLDLSGYIGMHQWHFKSRFSSGVCVIGEVRGDAIEAARVLIGKEDC